VRPGLLGSFFLWLPAWALPVSVSDGLTKGLYRAKIATFSPASAGLSSAQYRSKPAAQLLPISPEFGSLCNLDFKPSMDDRMVALQRARAEARPTACRTSAPLHALDKPERRGAAALTARPNDCALIATQRNLTQVKSKAKLSSKRLRAT
jgi:hypothetical protein